MIVRDRPSGLRMFWLLRGSVLPRILPTLIVNIVVATLMTLSHGDLFDLKITLTAIPFSLIGLPIAIFLGFRNNSAYDRFWEGRKLWGELVLRSRNFSRQCQSFISYPDPATVQNGLADLRVRMILRAAAFAHALRQLLREEEPRQNFMHLLQDSEWHQMQTAPNPPDFLMHRMGQDLRLCLQQRRLDAHLALALDNTLSAMTSAAASCERIRNTPIPFSYTLLLHRTAYIYCFLLPFGLVDSIGFMTPFVVAVVAYTFFGLDALGDEIEEPFGMESNDLPLDAICRAIEIDMRASLHDTHVPALLEPLNYRLT